MTKRLATVDQVIDAFGGERRPADNNKKVAVWCGINTSAVCNWRDRNTIPSGWHLRFYLEAKRREMEIEPSVFGLEACDAAPAGGMVVKKKRSNGRAKGAAESRAA